MVIEYLGSWRQYIYPLRFQSPTVKDTKKGAQKWPEGPKQDSNQDQGASQDEGASQDQAAQRAALQNHDLIGVATLVSQTNLPENSFIY